MEKLIQKVVVIGHGYTSRLAVIRSVAQIGCEITVIVMAGRGRFSKKLNTKKPIDCYSKYVSHVFYCYCQDELGLIQLLLDKCTDTQKKVIIIPDSDFSAAVIDKNQDILREYFLFPHIHHTPGAVELWMDKMKQKTLATTIGLSVASSTIIRVEKGHFEIPEIVNYPCFTKPLATIVGGKQNMKRCNNEEELKEVLYNTCDIGDMHVLVEDYKQIEIEYAALGFSDGHEVIIPGVIQIIDLAKGFHFGVARRGKIMPIDGFEELIDKFKQFVLSVGFVGVFDIDFYKSGGEIYFDELNLRIGGSMCAYTQMGVNLPAMMVKTLMGESIADVQKQISELQQASQRLLQELPENQLSECRPQLQQMERIAEADQIALHLMKSIRDGDGKEAKKQLSALKKRHRAILKAEKKALISDKAAKAFLDEVIKYADSVYENGKK